MKTRNLDKPPKYTRFSFPGAMPVPTADSSAIQPTGGDYGGGLIPGVSVLCRGEALGHGMWCDDTMLSQAADAINASGDGIKSRFTHPGMSSDGLAKFMGRSKNATVKDGKVIADKHLALTAHKTPEGNLAGYVMGRAKEDPASFGTSIVFERDAKAETEFMLANGAEIDDEGYFDRTNFKSPDPDNINNYPHARIAELRAVDFVDDPAANPEGLFHRGDEAAKEASELMAFALGLPGAERPEVTCFDLDPDRVAGFVSRFLTQYGLKLVSQKEEQQQMATTIALTAEEELRKKAAAAAALAKKDGDDEDDDEEEEEDDDEGCAADDEEEETPPVTGKKAKKMKAGPDFIAAFGTQGAVWFAEGKTFAQAKALHAKSQSEELAKAKQENVELRKALKLATGEDTPVSFNGERSPTEENEAKAKTKFRNLPPNVARFAAGIVIPRIESVKPGRN